jgi:hypothetical protein
LNTLSSLDKKKDETRINASYDAETIVLAKTQVWIQVFASEKT